MAYKTIQRVFVPNLKLFGPMNTTLQSKDVESITIIGEFSITLYEKWTVGHSFVRHGFRNIRVWRLSKL